jgi:hypothetical protein
VVPERDDRGEVAGGRVESGEARSTAPASSGSAPGGRGREVRGRRQAGTEKLAIRASDRGPRRGRIGEGDDEALDRRRDPVVPLGLPAPAQDKKDDAKKMGGVLQDVNLHDLTIAVQKITKKTILWTEDLGLRNKRVHFVSDKPIADDPEVLWKAYLSILQVTDLTLNSIGKEGEEIYKLKPAPIAGKGNVPVQNGTSTCPRTAS